MIRSFGHNLFSNDANFGEPAHFSGTLVFSANDVVEFGMIVDSNISGSLFGISASNKIFLKMIKIT